MTKDIATELQTYGDWQEKLVWSLWRTRSLFLKALEHYAQTTIRDMRDRVSAEGSPLANLKQLLLE
ncbi:MAG: hypothetical protein QNJ46_35095 [Leptolyngbyaceae cyanobacterium MO_188.B28]|nr:hypothetical protein [Leptolyngbyaceae cyanobacterium MO_188.B28]